MTFDDDFIQLETASGTRRIACKKNGIDWPPPEVLEIEGFHWRRISYSALTDEERKGLTLVVRGAAYAPVEMAKMIHNGDG